MKKESFSGKTKDDLLKSLRDNRETLRNFHFAASGTKNKNPKDAKVARKNIARILTEMNKK